LQLVLSPLLRFIKFYLLRLGFLDGVPGLVHVTIGCMKQFQQVRETEGAGARLGMTILVTGGAGFIGSNFVLDWFAQGAGPVINLEQLTYAGNPANLQTLKDNPEHVFVHGDICDRELVRRLLERHTPRAIVHFRRGKPRRSFHSRAR